MSRFDETDMEILTLLGEDARRPFSDIADEVGLSGPAVSDRVDRLREAGVIRRFTVDVDRFQLTAGVPVLVRVDTGQADTEAVKGRIGQEQNVEHVFVTATGDVWFYGQTQPRQTHQWVEASLDGLDTDGFSVTLIDEAEWQPSIEGSDFAISCAECGNTVDDQGESTRIDDQLYHFCCTSCQARFEDRYDRIEEGA